MVLLRLLKVYYISKKAHLARKARRLLTVGNLQIGSVAPRRSHPLHFAGIPCIPAL